MKSNAEQKMKILTIALQLNLGALGAYALLGSVCQTPTARVVIVSLVTMVLGFGAGISEIISLRGGKR